MSDDRPLSGIRVCELTIAIAAPTCGRYMAHFGAEVVKVESLANPDILRLFGSAWCDQAEHGRDLFGESGPYVNEFATGKLSVGLDLKHPAGMEAACRLLGSCDVFLTNYSAPAVRDLGLGFESVRAVKDDIVYVAVPGFSLDPDAPYYDFLAWGPNQAPLVGLDELTGYEDQPPAGIATVSYPDYSNGLHATLGALAALEERDRTGEAQLMVLSQFEATVSMLGPFLLDNARTGRAPRRDGNRTPWWAPEGVYECRGEDRWVAVSVTEDSHWAQLCEVLGRPDWAADPSLGTHEGRAACFDELDEGIAAWTADKSAGEAAAWLQAAGVPAAEVLDPAGLVTERHLQDREFWLWGDSHRFGRDLATGNPVRLSDTPGGVDRVGPSVAQDNAYVLGELCGYGDDEIVALIETGAAFAQVAPEVRFRRPYLDWAHIAMPQIPWDQASLTDATVTDTGAGS